MDSTADHEANRRNDLLDKVARVTERHCELDARIGFGSAYGPWLESAMELASAGLPEPVRSVPALCEHQLLQRLGSITGTALLQHFSSQSVTYETGSWTRVGTRCSPSIQCCRD